MSKKHFIIKVSIAFLLSTFSLFSCQEESKLPDIDFLIEGKDLPKSTEWVGNVEDGDTMRIFQAWKDSTIHFKWSLASPPPKDLTWNFGDGNTVSGATAIHVFTETGKRYEIKCCVGESKTCAIKYVFTREKPNAQPLNPPEPTPPSPVPCAIPPKARCKNIERQWVNATTPVQILPEEVDKGSKPGCGTIIKRTLSETSFAKPGSNVVTMTIENNNGAKSTCNATVTIIKSKPAELKRTNTVALGTNLSDDCMVLQGGKTEFTITTKQLVELRSLVVWADHCGRLEVAISGQGIASDDVLSLAEGRNDISLLELYARLQPDNSYTLSLRPIASEKCEETPPSLKDFSKCYMSEFNNEHLKIRNNGKSVIFNLKYAYQ